MSPVKKMVRYGIIGGFAAMVMVAGCTKRPSQDDLARLDAAREAAASAERKLSELRRERMQLEATLAEKTQELQRHEEERDVLKEKMGQ